MKTIREMKVAKAQRKAMEENPLAVWQEVFAKSNARAKARCHKEARERDLKIASCHAFLKVL